MAAYGDIRAEMDQLLASPPRQHPRPWAQHRRISAAEIFTGSWAARDWRNVPGPYYTAETDTCGGGRAFAPSLVLVTEHWNEFVYRQPTDSAQLLQLLDAAYDDPFGGYGSDGNSHWTPELVRSWWADRNRLLDWIAAAEAQMAAENAPEEVVSLGEFRTDIEGPLEARLEAYALWLAR